MLPYSVNNFKKTNYYRCLIGRPEELKKKTKEKAAQFSSLM